MTAATPTSTSSMVDDLVREMRAAAGGDATAASRLDAATEKEAEVEETPMPAATDAATCDEKTVIRPNGDVYHVRKMGPHDDIAVVRRCRVNRLPMLMYGVPGCGKTALFEAAFTGVHDGLSAGFEYVPGSGDTEVSDFIGGYTPTGDPDNPFMWQDGPLLRAMENGLPLLVDEIALVDPKVMAVVYSVGDGRGVINVTANPKRGIVSARPGFALFGACNPNAPGARMSEALLSRFLLHAEVGVDFGLMRKMGVPTRVVTAAQNMKAKFDEQQMSWYPAIRELLGFKLIAEQFGQEVALSNLASQAPENDRPTVIEVLRKAFGAEIKSLVIS